MSRIDDLHHKREAALASAMRATDVNERGRLLGEAARWADLEARERGERPDPDDWSWLNADG